MMPSFGRLGDLPALQKAMAAVRHAAAMPITPADRALIADRFELNKGWFAHEINPDNQALMLAVEMPVVSLREARQARGWTQAQVAKLAGVSVSAVSVAERLTRGVSAEARARIQRVFMERKGR